MAPQFHESESDGPSGGHGASGDGPAHTAAPLVVARG
jgi:hypothetical protein